MKNKAFLQLPPGSAGLFLEEAARHQAAIDATNQLYSRWGYTMVHTPMVDYFDAHSHMLSDGEESRIYRLIGRDGEVLMLRSDITLFLLKHLQSLLNGADLPLRLSYSDSILRHEDSIDISRNDHYQTGVELIGNNASEEDLEILLLLGENLQALEVDAPAIHMGSRKIFSLVFSDISDPHILELIQSSIIHRNWDDFDQLLGDLDMDAAVLKNLFSYIGSIPNSPDSLKNVITTLPAKNEIQSELEYLENLAGQFSKYFPETTLRIDLSEIGLRDYYSGLVFYVYVDGLPYPIASGGRYNKLIEEMELDAGAVGYSLMLGALQKLPGNQKLNEIISLKNADGNLSIGQRYEKARKLRKEGKSVCL